MTSANAGKIGFIVIALGAAGFIAYKTLAVGDPVDQTMVGQICHNPECKAEFEITLAEQKRLGRERRSATCPKCGKSEVATGHKCGNCGRMNQPFGHGSAPPACTYCKKKWVYADDPK